MVGGWVKVEWHLQLIDRSGNLRRSLGRLEGENRFRLLETLILDACQMRLERQQSLFQRIIFKTAPAEIKDGADTFEHLRGERI